MSSNWNRASATRGCWKTQSPGDTVMSPGETMSVWFGTRFMFSGSDTSGASERPRGYTHAAAQPPPYKLLWYYLAGSGGDVLLRPHPAGIAVIPAFLATTIEGSTAAADCREFLRRAP